jgi:hypothetical protein
MISAWVLKVSRLVVVMVSLLIFSSQNHQRVMAYGPGDCQMCPGPLDPPTLCVDVAQDAAGYSFCHLIGPNCIYSFACIGNYC